MTGDKEVDGCITWFLTIQKDQWICDLVARGFVVAIILFFIVCFCFLVKSCKSEIDDF